MSRFVVAPQALADLRRIGDWIAEDNPRRAASFLEDLQVRFQTLAEMPLIGRARDEFGRGTRSLVCGNFVVFYRVAVDHVAIARVIHAKRDLRKGLPPA